MNFRTEGPGRGLSCPTPGDILNELSQIDYEKLGRFATFSTAVYDTAWVSMVPERDNSNGFAFPRSFQYLLDIQGPSGTWNGRSQHDEIIGTLAGLLALVRRNQNGQISEEWKLDQRIDKATAGVKAILMSYKMKEIDYVGFEVLITSLLRQLETFGIHLDFPARPRLTKLCERKLKKFSPEFLYGKQMQTLHHSLEAFSGMIDFDRVRHHCNEKNGIFGSPAATASYLINSSEWDQRAYKYLQDVSESYGNTGAVPSAFPTCLFELSWAVSTLLRSSTVSEMPAVKNFLTGVAERQSWLIGFAPGVLEDADDTARTIITLKRLGQDINAAPMIARFETKDHFQTYPLERNPSFSAHCNVLLALLELENVDDYVPQIDKIMSFLLSRWTDGNVSDKWNLSPRYSEMLMAEALVAALIAYDSGKLQALPASYTQEKIPVTICQILQKTLWDQENDGSWQNCLEVTSYALITIDYCLHLPWSRAVIDRLNQASSQGREYIKSQYPSNPSISHPWVEKTTYELAFLKLVYCSAALHADTNRTKVAWSHALTKCFQPPAAEDQKVIGLFKHLPIFKKSPVDPIELVLLEARHFFGSVAKSRSSNIERDNISMTTDKYIRFIPMIWAACNNINGHALPSSVIHDMTLLSLYNYQIDEFVESTVADLPDEDIETITADVEKQCGFSPVHHSPGAPENGYTTSNESRKRKRVEKSSPPPDSVQAVINSLRKFIEYVLQHQKVVKSPHWLRRELAIELYNYITGQFRHNQDNKTWAQLRQDGKRAYVSPDIQRGSYFKWLHSTGEDDTSCPFSFLFFTCLISNSEQEACFDGPRARYFSQSLARHLAAMCRMYNDYGSAVRDAAEGNLNSLDFAEFHGEASDVSIQTNGMIKNGETNGNGLHTSVTGPESANLQSKPDLMSVAEFERAAMELSLKHLTEVVDHPATMKALKVFIDVTDTFGQVYVQKDIASRKVAHTNGNGVRP